MTTLSLAGALTLHAQAPQAPSAPPQPQASQPASDVQRPIAEQATKAADGAVTITGCLKNEADVPGLKASAERAAGTEDFVLTDVKMSPLSRVSGIGVAAMYEIGGLPGADLKKHVNHQVELTGRLPEKSDANDKAPDFHATGLKMLAATCTP